MTTSDRARLESVIRQVLEGSSSFCLDNEEERAALVDTLQRDILGLFKVTTKSRRSWNTALSDPDKL